MDYLSFIIWSADPDIFVIPGLNHPVRWYGLLFAMGFILSQQVMFYVFKKDGRDEKEVETLTMYMVVAVIVGARLGHCLFYDPVMYLTNPHKILFIWEGGLASHGGAIGILTALYLFARKMKGMTYFWMLDRIVIVVCLTGAMIRTGNFMNSEMIGIQTDFPLGVVYTNNLESGLSYVYRKQIEDIDFTSNDDLESTPEGLKPISAIITFQRGASTSIDANQVKMIYQRDEYYSNFVAVDQPITYSTFQEGNKTYGKLDFYGIPRHPAQLYEAFYCLMLFFLLAHLWYWHRHKLNEGVIFGIFLVTLWSLRFFDEYLKLSQEPWEDGLPLNMGQILSIPLVIAGIVILIKKSGKKQTA
ncbi:MAG: prolipoprotein diacylglyceryl transferase [Cyclobacteriaceae bacterium]